jgi:hypothetical protein
MQPRTKPLEARPLPPEGPLPYWQCEYWILARRGGALVAPVVRWCWQRVLITRWGLGVMGYRCLLPAPRACCLLPAPATFCPRLLPVLYHWLVRAVWGIFQPVALPGTGGRPLDL